MIDAVRAREHDPVEGLGGFAGRVERVGSSRRQRCGWSAPGWPRRRGPRACRLSSPDLFARSRHDDAAAEQRPVVEPAQVLAQAGDARRPPAARAASVSARSAMSPERARHRLLRRRRAVVDERGGFVRRAAVRQQRLRDRARSGGARRSRPACRRVRRGVPSRLRRRVGLGFVAADEGPARRRPGIGDRHARRRPAPPIATGMPGTTSNGMPCSCRNSASLPPLSNTNGSPHFSRTTVRLRAPSPRAGSRSHPGRAACGAAAPTSMRSASGGRCRSSRASNAVVVDDDIRRLQAARPAHADQRRIARAGADDVERMAVSVTPFDGPSTLPDRVEDARPRRRAASRSATRRPSATGSSAGPRPRARSTRGRPASDDRVQRRARSPSCTASPPSGSWQPPPSAATSARSASSATRRRCVVQRLHRRPVLVVARRDLDRDDALPGRRHAMVDRKRRRDPVAEAEPPHAGGRQDQRIVLTLIELAQPACRRCRESARTRAPGRRPAQLRDAPDAARADGVAARQGVRAPTRCLRAATPDGSDQRVARDPRAAAWRRARDPPAAAPACPWRCAPRRRSRRAAARPRSP